MALIRVPSSPLSTLAIIPLQSSATCPVSEKKFISLLGPFLTRFVFENGGRLTFPTTAGLFLIPVLKTLFKVPWERGSYYATTWRVRQDLATRLDITFLIHNFLPNATRASRMEFHAKAYSLIKVSEEDGCFGWSTVCNSHGIVRSETSFVGEKHKSKHVGEESADSDDDDGQVVVATRTCGPGKICFFGDVNACMATADLVFAFCLA